MLIGDHWEDLDICRWEDNVKMDLKETVWGGLMWLRIWTS
jgi:hypothetical protein